MADDSVSPLSQASTRGHHRESSSSPIPTSESPASSSINSLLDTFETAWMGGPKTTAKSALSSLLQDSRANGSSNVFTGGNRMHNAGGQISHPLMTPWTQVPVSTTSATMPVASKRQHEVDAGDDAGLAMLPMTPFPSHMLKSLGGDSPPVGAKHAAAPVPMPTATLGMKAAPGSGQPGQDFAPVFFSPIPLSYLNIARSESESSFLDSVGSPDVTLRGGRLAKASGDWGDTRLAASGAANVAGSPSSGSPLSSSRQNSRSRLASDIASFPLGSVSEINATGSEGPSVKQHSLLSGGASGSGGRPGALSTSVLQHPIMSRPPVASSPTSTSTNLPLPAAPVSSMALLYPLDSGAPSVMGSFPSGGISIAAAASGRRHNQSSGILRLVAGTAMIPHIDKVWNIPALPYSFI